MLIDGQRHGRTFDTKEDAYYWAAGLKTKSIEESRTGNRITVEKAFDRYIENKSAILSPSTVAGYRKIQRLRLDKIRTTRLCDLTQDTVQKWVNSMVKSGLAPKTVAEAHGLLSAVVREFNPGAQLTTTLPQKAKQEIQIPSEAELRAIIEASKGTKYELPILMAIWLGMRQSEIVGLKWENIKGDRIHIVSAIVTGEDGPIEKGTKTTSGTRSIRCPKYILDLIEQQPKKTAYVVNLSGHAIYNGFRRICAKNDIPHYRFHDLRHVNASAMLAKSIPDKYSQKRMGHATTNMLKTVYQHTFKEREVEYDDRIDSYFEELIKTGE